MAWVEKSSSGRYLAKYRDADGKKRTADGGPFTHKKAAERAAAAAELAARSLGWRDPSAAARPWGEWCDEWWPTRQREASTMATDAGRIEKILRPKWGEVRLIDITRQDILAWAAELATYTDDQGVQRHRQPGTVKRIVNLLSVSLGAAVDKGILSANPALRLHLPEGGTLPDRYLTRDELSAICAHLSGHDLAMTLLLAGTGLRYGEAAGIHRPRVDAERRMLLVAETWSTRGRHMKAYPKGRRRRSVPIPGWVDLSALEIEPVRGSTCSYEHLTGSCAGPLLLTTPAGAMVEYSRYETAFAAAVRRADVGHVRVHDLRHTYASWLIQAGRPLSEVGKLLGHVSPITTQRYAHLAETPADAVLAALGSGPATAASATEPVVVDELAARRARRSRGVS